MRTVAILMTLLFAGCHERPHPSVPSEARDVYDDPRVVRADPEAVNYARPGWTLEIGDTVTRQELGDLCSVFCEVFGFAVVWVVGESGRPMPFSASFAFAEDDPSISYRDQRYIYIGHDAEQLALPVWAMIYNQVVHHGGGPPPAITDIPASLRQVVGDDFAGLVPTPRWAEVGWDRWYEEEDAWWEDMTARGISSLDIYRRAREKHYGPGVSW